MVWQMRVFSLEPGPWSLGLILQKSRIENVRQNPEPGKHERKIQKESAVWCLRQTNGPRAGPACQLASRARQSSGPELTTASSEKLRVDRVAIKALQSQESSQNARIRSRIKKAESTERRSHMPCMETTWRHKSQTLFSIKRIIPWTFFDKIKNNLTVEILTTVWNWHLLRVTTSKHKRACQKLALRLGSEPLWTYVKIYATWRKVSQTKQLIAAASQSFAGIHGLRGSKDESSCPRTISAERAKKTRLRRKISGIQTRKLIHVHNFSNCHIHVPNIQDSAANRCKGILQEQSHRWQEDRRRKRCAQTSCPEGSHLHLNWAGEVSYKVQTTSLKMPTWKDREIVGQTKPRKQQTKQLRRQHGSHKAAWQKKRCGDKDLSQTEWSRVAAKDGCGNAAELLLGCQTSEIGLRHSTKTL